MRRPCKLKRRGKKDWVESHKEGGEHLQRNDVGSQQATTSI
jgi:hypothetical protein